MFGIYPEDRPSLAPTNRAIIERFEDLTDVIMKHNGEQHKKLADLTSVQRKLIDLTSIPPAALKVFKAKVCNRACEACA